MKNDCAPSSFFSARKHSRQIFFGYTDLFKTLLIELQILIEYE